jgi:dihydroorotate dehydrogenase
METTAPRPHLLPLVPSIPERIARRVRVDHDRFASGGLPADLDGYLAEAYGLDLAASYAGIPLRNPWGKASGQLTLRLGQLEEAAAAGLGFAVLKTVIAQDAGGEQSMAAWAIKESRMVAEPITSPATGATGWTITWRGRGWWQSFDDYLALVREGTALGIARALPVVPSVKYHLPAPGETEWRSGEYEETTRRILDAWHDGGGVGPMPLEKDFSPTLAGADRAARRSTVMEWLRRVPELIRAAAPGQVRVGLKLFNSLDHDDFQRAMLAAVHGPARPDFLIHANRLFNPDRVFEGTRGVAYGGPDLSDRNLRMLSALRAAQARGEVPAAPLEISGTGDISSGRLAVEYALRGCTSFQIHTLFQLPAEVFAMKVGTKLQRALHRLVLDPEEGFVVWAHHAARRLGLALDEDSPVRFLDLAARGAASALTPRDLDPKSP